MELLHALILEKYLFCSNIFSRDIFFSNFKYKIYEKPLSCQREEKGTLVSFPNMANEHVHLQCSCRFCFQLSLELTCICNHKYDQILHALQTFNMYKRLHRE